MKKIRTLGVISLGLLLLIGCNNTVPKENAQTDTIINSTPPGINSYPNIEARSTVTNTIGNSNANLVNDGLSAIQDDWIYFCTADGLFRVNIDGSIETKIYSSGDGNNYISHINVLGEWIYYDNYFDGVRGLYKIKTDGTQNQLIITGCGQPHVIDDAIFCYDGGLLYVLNTDETEYTRRFPSSLNSGFTFNVYDGWVYASGDGFGYNGDYAIYRIRTDGTEEEVLYPERTDYLVVSDEYVYFQGYRDYKLYRMKLDGSELEQVFEDSLLWNFNVTDGWIYYCNRDDTCLYKIRIDGTDKQMICSDWATEINVVGDWIFYILNDDSPDDILYKIKTDGSDRQEVGIRKTLITFEPEDSQKSGAAQDDFIYNDPYDYSGLSNGDFSAIAGAYAPYPQFFDWYGGGGVISITDIKLKNDGTVTETGDLSYLGTKPISVTQNKDGSFTCIVSNNPQEHYVIYPPGVADDYDLKNDKLRICYTKLDGGALEIVYYKTNSY